MVLVTARLAPPRHRDQAGRCLPRCGDTARPHRLAGRDAGGRHRLRPARLHADAAIAAAAAGEAAWTPRQRGRYRPANLDDLDRARCRRHGIRPQHIAVGVRRRVRAPASCLMRRRHRAGPRRPHRAAYRPAARRSRRSGAGAGRRHRSLRDRPLADRCRSLSGRVSGRPRPLGLEHRAAVSAHALRPRHRRARATAVRRRRPGIWIGIASCIIARSKPTFAS